MIVLDTHAWVWYIDSPAKVGARAARAIERHRANGDGIHVSCVSTWELHMLAARDRLTMSIPPEAWVSRCEQLSFLHFQALNNSIAFLAVSACAGMHGDPADRMIAATALYLGATLITCDEKIRLSGIVDCIW